MAYKQRPLTSSDGGTGLTTSGTDSTKALKSDGAGGFVMGTLQGSSTVTDSTGANIAQVSTSNMLQTEDVRVRRLLNSIEEQAEQQTELTGDIVDLISNIIPFNWLGTWTSTNSYKINDAVAYLGAAYICVVGNSNQTPSSTSGYWNVLMNAGTIPSYSSSMTANVTPTSNVYTDLVTLSLPAGTWLVTGKTEYTLAGAAVGGEAKITDGTTNYASASGTTGGAAFSDSLTMVTIITLTATTTIKLQGTTNNAGTFQASTTVNSSGNTATQINAIQLSSGNVGTINGLQSLNTKLAADVAVTQNVWTDTVSLTLGAGTWLLIGQLNGTNAGAFNIDARIYDGTNSYSSGLQNGVAGGQSLVTIQSTISLSVTTTIKLQANSTQTGTTASAAMIANGVGNNATQLTAIQLAAGTSAATLSTANSTITANVTVTASTWTDIASVVLAAGTWKVDCQAVFSADATQKHQLRISDGTTTYCSNEHFINANVIESLACSTLITLTSQTTIKMQGNSITSNATVVAAISNNATGNNATQITAIKVG